MALVPAKSVLRGSTYTGVWHLRTISLARMNLWPFARQLVRNLILQAILAQAHLPRCETGSSIVILQVNPRWRMNGGAMELKKRSGYVTGGLETRTGGVGD